MEPRPGEGKSLGSLVSELLAPALQHVEGPAPPGLTWTAKPMTALVDLEDKEALRRAIDQS